MNGKRPIKTNKTGNKKKPPCPSCGAEKRFRLFSTKKPCVHSPFVALSTAMYHGMAIMHTKTEAGIRYHVKITFHFFVNAIHINIHNPGKANATGPLASVAKPRAAAAT